MIKLLSASAGALSVAFRDLKGGKKAPADQCQPFDTVARILELEKQVAELRAALTSKGEG